MGTGRLAMLAFLGFAVQALTQGEGALGELAALAPLAFLGVLTNGVFILRVARRTV